MRTPALHIVDVQDMYLPPGLAEHTEWTPESALDAALGAAQLLPYRPAFGYGARVTLFHGTRKSALATILAAGFKVACSCPWRRRGGRPQPCTCGMLGPGVYFAAEDKASSNAGRAAAAEAPGGGGGGGEDVVEGIVLECLVDVGRCAVLSFDSACACCGHRGGVDHAGSWASRYDTAFLNGGGPAAKRAEWCVRDPRRVVVTAYHTVSWTRDRRYVSRGPRVPV